MSSIPVLATVCCHVPDQPAVMRLFEYSDDGYVFGRGDDNAVVLLHRSVSRRHARVRYDGETWWIEDLSSTNGVRIGGHQVACQALKHGDWFSLGDVFCEFKLLDAKGKEAYAERSRIRRETSGIWLDRLAQAPDRDALLAGLIAAIVQLAECRRGFMLVGGLERGFSTVACCGVSADAAMNSKFAGSNGALARAIHERRPILVNDPAAHDWARRRHSIVGRGLRALIAVPVLHRDHLLGVAYADSDAVGKVFTELDFEILSAFSEQAALLLAARGLDEMLANLESCIQANHEGVPGEVVAARPWAGLA